MSLFILSRSASEALVREGELLPLHSGRLIKEKLFDQNNVSLILGGLAAKVLTAKSKKATIAMNVCICMLKLLGYNSKMCVLSVQMS